MCSDYRLRHAAASSPSSRRVRHFALSGQAAAMEAYIMAHYEEVERFGGYLIMERKEL